MSGDWHEDVVVYDSSPGFVLYAALSGLLTAGFASFPGLMPLAAVTFAHTLWSVVRASWRKPRIRITAEGIVDDTFWYSPGLIRWSDIREVRSTRWGLVQVELFDEDAYIQSLHPIKTLALLKQQLYGFPPAIIVPWGLQGARRDLVAQLQDGLDRWAVEAASRGELAGPTLDDD